MAKRCVLPSSEDALPGRSEAMKIENLHAVLQTPIKGPFPSEVKVIYFGMGCFWGAERKFWQLDGIYTTAVGYIGGYTQNPSYDEVCTGKTGHNEAVLVAYDVSKRSLNSLLEVFWASHDPTQGMRQGNDLGTQYRSGIYITLPEQQDLVEESRRKYQQALMASNYSEITTEIVEAGEFYYAEPYHQQYLIKNPNGYCGLGGTGVPCHL